MQLELIEKAQLAAKRARCDTVPYPDWQIVDKAIPTMPQSAKYVGSFAREYQEYLAANHDGEEDVEDSLPELIHPSTPSQSAPRPQTMTRTTDDVDEAEFLQEVASGGDDDEEDVDDSASLLPELATRVLLMSCRRWPGYIGHSSTLPLTRYPSHLIRGARVMRL